MEILVTDQVLAQPLSKRPCAPSSGRGHSSPDHLEHAADTSRLLVHLARQPVVPVSVPMSALLGGGTWGTFTWGQPRRLEGPHVRAGTWEGARQGGCPRALSSPHTHVRLILLSVEDPQQRRVLVPPEIQRDVVHGCNCGGVRVSQAVSLARAGPRGAFLWILVFKLVVQLIPTSVLTDQCAFQPSGCFLIMCPVCSRPLFSILLLGSLDIVFPL